MSSQFAKLHELCFPHHDRVALRKRYLNIERRFKVAQTKSETDIEPLKAKKAPSVAAKKEPNKSPTSKGKGKKKVRTCEERSDELIMRRFAELCK